MKPELNTALKARFFAQYWGQKVIVTRSNFYPIKLGEELFVDDTTMGNYLVNPKLRLALLLRPITSITDEEAIEVAKAATNLMTDWNSSPNKKYFTVNRDGKYKGIGISEKYSVRSVYIDPVDGEITVYEDESELSATCTLIWGYQLMLSYGICLPFMGYSIEELVNAGWVRLVEV